MGYSFVPAETNTLANGLKTRWKGKVFHSNPMEIPMKVSGRKI
jgi:hypothetical protein